MSEIAATLPASQRKCAPEECAPDWKQCEPMTCRPGRDAAQPAGAARACQPECLPQHYCNPTCSPGACQPRI